MICFVSLIFVYFFCIKVSKKLERKKNDTEYIHNHTGWGQIEISMTMCYCVSILRMSFLYHHTLIPSGVYVQASPTDKRGPIGREKVALCVENRVYAKADRFCSTTLTCLQLLLPTNQFYSIRHGSFEFAAKQWHLLQCSLLLHNRLVI